MDPTAFIPIIVEATKFIFGEGSKWLDRAQKEKPAPVSESSGILDQRIGSLTIEDFAAVQNDPQSLAQMINTRMATTNVYIIQNLTKEIQIHHKNLSDFGLAEAEHGALTPQYIKRGMEREDQAITEKTARLKNLLAQIYVKDPVLD